MGIDKTDESDRTHPVNASLGKLSWTKIAYKAAGFLAWHRWPVSDLFGLSFYVDNYHKTEVTHFAAHN